MEVELKSPKELSDLVLAELLLLIEEGDEVNIKYVKAGLKRAELIAYVIENGKVISTATVKNPLPEYKLKVFTKAKVEALGANYTCELGYIATRKEHEGKGICQNVLKELLSHFIEQTLFATTRKPAMKHILTKFGFKLCGELYNQDLQIMTKE